MNEFERVRATQWLKRVRGGMSQDALARDITASLGWTITRDRYSRYESGSLPFGRSVLQHFIDYWASKGVAGPDFTPEPVVVSNEERAVVAQADLAAAVKALADELAALREERAVMREERAAVRLEAQTLRAQREAWERGVIAVLRQAAAGQVPAELLDALVPQPL